MDHPIARAIQAVGSQDAVATALKVRQPTVSEWLRNVRPVPPDRCPSIERLTVEAAERGGAKELIVRCEELRPDVRWVRVPDRDWPLGRPCIDVAAAAA